MNTGLYRHEHRGTRGNGTTVSTVTSGSASLERGSMTEYKLNCDRCGAVGAEEDWGVTLYDDYAVLDENYGVGIDLCDECKEKFERWMKNG